MRSPVFFEASRISAASSAFEMVCISMPSKPTDRASANWSAYESCFGSIVIRTAFLMLAACPASDARPARTALSSSWANSRRE
jgi:hypothetical protein